MLLYTGTSNPVKVDDLIHLPTKSKNVWTDPYVVSLETTWY